MAPGGTAFRISSVAPGQGTVSVVGQKRRDGRGNVAAINRQTAALQDLNQARLDDPNVGRFRFGTDGMRRGVDPLDVASGRTDSLGTLLPDVSRARTSQQLQLAEMAQRANALRLQDSSRPGQDSNSRPTRRAPTRWLICSNSNSNSAWNNNAWCGSAENQRRYRVAHE